MKKDLSISIASLPDREELVAELWYGDDMCAEVSRQGESFQVEIYKNPVGSSWKLELDSLVQKLREARDTLGAE